MKIEFTPQFKLSLQENYDTYTLEIKAIFFKTMDDKTGITDTKFVEQSMNIGNLLISMIDNKNPTFIDQLFDAKGFNDVIFHNNKISKLEKISVFEKFKKEIKNSIIQLRYCVDQVLRIDDFDELKSFNGNETLQRDLRHKSSLPTYKRLLFLDLNNFFNIKNIDVQLKHNLYTIIDGERCKLSSPDEIKSYQDIDITFETSYIFNSFIDLLRFEFFEMIKRNIPVRKCLLCGNWFIPYDKRDTLYCNRIYKHSKTCKDIGATERYKAKIKNDSVFKEFEKARNRQQKRKKVDCDEEYALWLEKANLYKDKYLSGEITEAECIEFFNSNRLRQRR